jgi:DNA-binding CsgD family transcriptional regulator
LLGSTFPALSAWRTVDAFQALRGADKALALSELARAYRELRTSNRTLSDGALSLCVIMLRGSLLKLSVDHLELRTRNGKPPRLIPGREPGELLAALAEEAARGVPVLLSAVMNKAQTRGESELSQVRLESDWSAAVRLLEEPPSRPDPFLLARLEEAIAKLSPADRRIAELLLEDLDPADIAARLGLTHGSAKVRCLQVRARLAALLRG